MQYQEVTSDYFGPLPPLDELFNNSSCSEGVKFSSLEKLPISLNNATTYYYNREHDRIFSYSRSKLVYLGNKKKNAFYFR